MPTEISVNQQPYPTATHIEMWPIDKLIPLALNPRGRTPTLRLRRSPPREQQHDG